MFRKRSPRPFDEWLIKERDALEKRLARSENLAASEKIKRKLDNIAIRLNLLRWLMSKELNPPK